ncbi:aminodeoxychorismate synthase component I [Pseudomonas sp. gcc21]|uniref:aminodeoxychorismate synthase component I n=1 Tax=Pseudomonas sp. gcc21 TaxID=2726989 RepID=UPI002114FA6B|nr:aminodeoxychorismate synthase component I [Pseudomonas sp. gcc21]
MYYTLTELPYAADPLPGFAAIRPLGLPVLLDSAASGRQPGRYSIMSAGPLSRVRPAVGESGREVLDRLRNALHTLGSARWPDGEALPFGAGALGFISYDFARLLEQLPADAQADIRLPRLQMGVYDWNVTSDHQQKRSWLVCHPQLEPGLRTELLERLDSAEATYRGFRLTTAFSAEQSRQDYQSAFERIQHYIHAGDCYQINLAQRFSAHCQGDPLTAYQRLRSACPTPFSAYLEDPGFSILCHSPERFLSCRDGMVETRPIKGTRKRGSNPEQDRALAEELLASPKDQAENLMIVDLLRNDLGRTCAVGSVKVPELFSLETYPNVHHLVSSITGQLAPEYDPLDLLAGAFPGGSITGAPKIRAMQIIEELEPVRRSLYCGSIGYIGCEGQMDLNISIRSLVHQDDRLYLWGGGGIVADSQAEAEYQETLTKVQVLMDALA